MTKRVKIFKKITRRAVSDKILRVEAFDVLKKIKYDGYQSSLAFEIYFFDKKLEAETLATCVKSVSGGADKTKSILFCYRQYLGC